MSEETDAIRQDIATVRDAMTDKIEQIETKVRGTVDTTVEQVGRLFDVEQQVRDRPWVALGIAAAVGYAAGSMGSSGAAANTHAAQRSSTYTHGNGSAGTSAQYASTGQHAAYQPEQGNDVMSELSDRFGNELRLITSAALAAGVNLLRDTIKQSVPKFDEEYTKVRHSGSTSEPTTGSFQEDRESIRNTTAVDPNIPLRNYEQSQSLS